MSEHERDLGDGLMLRWSTEADADRMADCVRRAFGSETEPALGLQHMTRRYMGEDYPFMGPDDFVYVEDTSKADRPIVACACYLREDWAYDDIPIPVARPEIVGTDPSYRRRGLIRALFEALHARAAADGTLLQGITGIPYFYRQFGYEYAVDLGGAVQIPVGSIPAAPAELCRLRQATLDDVPAIVRCYARLSAANLIEVRLPESFWRYHIEAETAPGQPTTPSDDGKLEGHFRLRVVEAPDGEFLGFALLPYDRTGGGFDALLEAFEPGVDLQTLAPAYLQALRATAESAPISRTDTAVETLGVHIGPGRLLPDVLPREWFARVDQPYAWYIRVPDVAAFVRRIAPSIERRLAASACAGRTGEVVVNLYREGLALGFDGGRLATVERLAAADVSKPRAAFPPMVFVQLLLGYRSLDELSATYPDAHARPEVAPLLRAIFPKVASNVFGN